jgi:hypothetical protein
MRKLVVMGGVCLAVGLLIGFFLGRFLLERDWSQPHVLERLSAADTQGSTGKGADPVPPAGTLVLRAAPLARARLVLADFTSKDPLLATLGDLANSDEGNVLNLELKNRGKCAISSFSGVAYGYDAYGKASRVNKGGEHFVAFSAQNVSDLGPSETHSLSVVLHNVETATLALAQVDQVTCTDGTRWARN